MHGVTDQSSTYLAKEREVYSENSLDWKVFLETLQEIRKWSQTTSVPVAFLAFPLIDSGRTGRNFNHYQLSSLSSNPQFTDFGRVLDTIRKYGMPVLYMLETFRTQAGDRPLTVSQWVGDLNTYGHRLVAETLLSFLFQEKLVDCSQSEIQPEDPHWKQESVLRTEAKEKWFEFNINYVKQLQFYEELRKLYPRDPWIVDQCGRIYFATKRWWDSYKTYSSLTNLAPTFTSPWYYMALSSNEQERIGQLENMLRVVPDDTITMQVLSGLYFGTQRKVEACRLLSRIMEIPRFVQQYEGSKEQYEKQKCREVLSR